MAQIILKSVSISIPNYSQESFSFRHKILGRNKILKNKLLLNNISLSISDGERVGLIGHNGAGKSSLLKLIAGSYFPSHGSFYVDGSISSLLDIKFGLDPEGNGIDNIRLKLLSMQVYPSSNIIDDIIEFSGLGEHIFYPLKHYSSGMLLRLGFSISTYITPDILLLDEWLSVGDLDFKDKSDSRMNHLFSNSSILIFASHDHDLLHDKCNRIITLDNGSISSDIQVN